MEWSLFEYIQSRWLSGLTYTLDIIYFSRYSLGKNFNFNQVGQKPR